MRKVKNLISVLCLALLFSFAIVYLADVVRPVEVYAYPDGLETPNPGNKGGSGLTASDLVDKGDQALGGVKEGLVKICLALFPVALLVCIIAILITHDPRKISGLIGTCITIIIATLAVLLINAGTLLDILKDIAKMFE